MLKKISEFANTVSNLVDITGFEISEGFFSILEDDLSISNACVDIIETFGFDGSLEDTANNTFNLLDIGCRSKWFDTERDLDIFDD